jgi:hypothetical protein
MSTKNLSDTKKFLWYYILASCCTVLFNKFWGYGNITSKLIEVSLNWRIDPRYLSHTDSAASCSSRDWLVTYLVIRLRMPVWELMNDRCGAALEQIDTPAFIVGCPHYKRSGFVHVEGRLSFRLCSAATRNQTDGEHCPTRAPEGRFVVEGKVAMQCIRLCEQMGTGSHS